LWALLFKDLNVYKREVFRKVKEWSPLWVDNKIKKNRYKQERFISYRNFMTDILE